MELCGWCKKCTGTNQLYRQLPDGSREATRKLCDECWRVFKTPSKKLQKLLKQGPVDAPCKPTLVAVRGPKVVTCDASTLTEWLCAGYTIIGVADTVDGVKRLQRLAGEVG